MKSCQEEREHQGKFLLLCWESISSWPFYHHCMAEPAGKNGVRNQSYHGQWLVNITH
jgi:hypothetical protein